MDPSTRSSCYLATGQISTASKTPIDVSLVNKKLKPLGTYSQVLTYVMPPDTMSQNRSLMQSPPRHGQDSNVPDNNGKTSLHTALEKGNLDAVQPLLDNGANVYQRDRSHQTPLGQVQTPLHKASRFERARFERALADGQDIGDAAIYGNGALFGTPVEDIYGANVPRLRGIRKRADPMDVMSLAGGFKL
jgi:hypothetical protein